MAFSMTNNDGVPYGKLFVIPQDPNDYEFLRSVDRKTRVDVDMIYGLMVDYDWQCNTIANCMVETIIKYLSYLLKSNSGIQGNGIGIEFYDILRAIVSIKTNERAEKEGNINIYFEPGEKVYDLIKNGPSEYPNERIPVASKFLTHDPVDDELYRNLDHQTRYNLSMINGVSFPDHAKFFVFAIGYTFLQNLYLEILYRLSNGEAPEEGEEKLITVNFNDNIEIHGILKDGEATITMRPGMNAKLLIKCDELTEHTMG